MARDAIHPGERNITAGTALRLDQFFGTGAELWMNLQKAYKLDKARIEIGVKINKINPWQPQQARTEQHRDITSLAL